MESTFFHRRQNTRLVIAGQKANTWKTIYDVKSYLCTASISATRRPCSLRPKHMWVTPRPDTKMAGRGERKRSARTGPCVGVLVPHRVAMVGEHNI